MRKDIIANLFGSAVADVEHTLESPY